MMTNRVQKLIKVIEKLVLWILKNVSDFIKIYLLVLPYLVATFIVITML